MNILRKVASATVAVAAAGVVLVGLPSAAQAAGTLLGCPSGYVCLWRNNYGSGGEAPAPFEYYAYGVYTLSGMYGDHQMVNNQTGGAVVELCTDWYGNSCLTGIPAGDAKVVNMTPYNSIVLKVY